MIDENVRRKADYNMIISCLDIQQKRSIINCLENVFMKQTVVKYDEESMIQKLKQIYQDTTQSVYFLKLRLPYQKIENGQVVNVTFYKLISEINRAMEKTENLFLELFGNKGILTTQINLLGDIDYEEINLKSFVEECMQGLDKVIEVIQREGGGRNKGQ